MKKTLLFIFATLLAATTFSQTIFGPVERYGFETNNKLVHAMTSFKGNLYVGIGNDTAAIYSSATGDPASFSPVYVDQSDSYYRVNTFAVTADSGGYIFAGVCAYTGYGGGKMANPNKKGKAVNVDQVLSNIGQSKVIYSSDGVTWNDYFQMYDSYNTDGNEPTTITMFKGLGTVDSVYISYNDGSNYYILKNGLSIAGPGSAGSWPTVVDFGTQFSCYAQVTASHVFKDTLYYTTQDNRMFKTNDGTNFVEDTMFAQTMGNLSTAGNLYVNSITDDGTYMYLGTACNTSNGGAQLWRTMDGVTYDSLYSNPSFEQFKSLTFDGSKIWMYASNYDVFSVATYNGAFNVENASEFGNLNLNALSGDLCIFNNHLYAGASQEFAYTPSAYYSQPLKLTPGNNETMGVMNTFGGQVYRACLNGTLPTVTLDKGTSTVVCDPYNVDVTLTVAQTYPQYLWSDSSTLQSLHVTNTGYYAVTVQDVNGCRNSADFSVIYTYHPPVDIRDTSNNQTNYGVVCSGDTSMVYTMHPEVEFNSLEITSPEHGLVLPGTSAFSSRQLTIEFWAKLDNSTNGILMTEYDVNGTWANNKEDVVEYWGGSYWLQLADTSSTYTDHEIEVGPAQFDQWNHIVLRYDGDTLRGWLNGVMNTNFDTFVWDSPAGPDAFEIGYNHLTGNAEHYVKTGLIRDLRIWNVARTDSEIVANMNGLTPGTYPNLVYYYNFNEGSGTVAHDSSGNGNDALVEGQLAGAQQVIVTGGPVIDLGNNQFRFNPTETIDYQVTYYAADGCFGQNTDILIEVPAMNYDGSVLAVCDTNNANIQINTSGTYTWTPTVNDLGGSVEPAVKPTVPTWFYVTGTTSSGNCPINDSLLIKVGPAWVSSMIPPADIYACENSEVVLHVTDSAGTAPFTYVWYYDGEGIIDTTNADSLVFNVGSNNSYFVSVDGYDAIGCPLQFQNNVYFNFNITNSTDLYGHVSTPAPSSLNVDNGYVYVFEHHPGTAGYDTVGYTTLNANGDYLFTPLDSGNYLIKVIANETAFPLEVPTYYGNTFEWDSSLVYVHGCTTNDTANIIMVEMDGTTGIASVSGYIKEGGPGYGEKYGNFGNDPVIPFVPGGPLKGIDVKLGKNPSGGIQARVSSDTTGFYQFLNVPPGSFKIYVDIPNLPMDSTRIVTIAPTDSSVQNNYYVDSTHIYIDTVDYNVSLISNKVYANKFVVYPNPAKGAFYVNYNLDKATEISFEINDVLGNVIRKELKRKFPQGQNTFVFDAYQLNMQPGIYFINMLENGTRYIQRIVITE